MVNLVFPQWDGGSESSELVTLGFTTAPEKNQQAVALLTAGQRRLKAEVAG